jgi:hypothetical protein
MTEALREDPVSDQDRGVDAPDDLGRPAAGRDERDAGLPPPTAVESLVNALLESGPEVAEHVVRAAQELLAAAQCIVDAAQDAVHEQQDVRRARASGSEGADAVLRHLDVAE